MSRISIDGISHSYLAKSVVSVVVQGVRVSETRTDDGRERRQEVDPHVEVLQSAPKPDKVGRKVFEQVVTQRELFDLVLELFDDLDRNICDALVTEIYCIESRD